MRTALLIIAGAFMGIPFLWSALWPLSLLGAALTYYALARTTSVRATLLGGTALGFIVNGLAYYGIFWHTLPLDWLEVFSLPVQLAIVGVSWFFTALGSAIWIGAGLALAKSFATNTWRDIPLVAGAWVFAEYAGAWWFGIQNAGPGSIVGPHFSLGYVGNLLATDAALLQLAPLGGVYILSASMFLLGGLVYFTLRSSGGERRRFLVVLACVVVLWGLTHVVLSRAKTVGGKQIRVALVTLQEAPVLEPSDDVRRQHVSRILRQIASSKERADVIVLPENAELFSHIQLSSIQILCIKMADSWHVLSSSIWNPANLSRAKSVFCCPTASTYRTSTKSRSQYSGLAMSCRASHLHGRICRVWQWGYTCKSTASVHFSATKP
jgi:apolipoprotein N-acyltransferase